MDSGRKSTGLRDASFSYLTRAQEDRVLKLTETVQHHLSTIIPAAQGNPFPVSLERPITAMEEGEISVFGAEKYFNMKLDDEGSRTGYADAGCKYVHQKEKSRSGLPRVRSKNRLGTPSVSSEASWNSQTALLHISSSQSGQQKKVNDKKWFFSGFACNGSCSNKKSVYIHQNAVALGKEHRKYHQTIRAANNPFMFDGRKEPSKSKFLLPTVNSGVQNKKIKEEEDPRQSLEVFGSHVMKKEDIAMNLERKLSVLTWDAIPTAPTPPKWTTSASSQLRYEDNESDSSSDLFEIEDLSGNAQPMFTKQASDGMSPASRYEPSETSIEWSVVTASAAADQSAASDYDEKKLAETSRNRGITSTTKKGRGSSVLGCGSHKAVEVAETAARKLQADNKVKDFYFL